MTTLKNAPIGVFDSGVGGLTVLNALWQTLPKESFVYLADTARIPYGTKSRETVIHYAKQVCTQLLRQHHIKALVIACNTASAHALTALQRNFPDLLVIGVIKPGASAAVAATQNQHIAVIATEGTIHYRAYPEAIASLNKNIRVTSKACSMLVPLVEEGWLQGDITDRIVQHYLQPIFNVEANDMPDTLVLGCTHYPLLRPRIENYVGKSVRVIDSATTTAKELAAVLQQRDLLNDTAEHSTQFLVTDSPQRFIVTANTFLGKALDETAVQHISV